MNKITLLDCTLRDGGYVNDWKFGDSNSQSIVSMVDKSKVDYVEVAFIKECEYEEDKIQFNHMDQLTALYRPSTTKLAVIVEVGYGYPVTSFPPRSEKTADLVRVIMWKRMLKEGFEYCKELIAKGYEVAIQATRTEQYSDEEFADFIKLFNQISPKAIYIVDTFGLLDKDQLFRYANIADKNLADGILLGYHAHNNMQQAFSNAVAFCSKEWEHDLMIDASVFGMGKGAGNLCLELLMKHLNDHHNCQYDISPLYEVYEKYLSSFYKMSPWGYSLPYFLSAINGLNPSYVNYLDEKEISIPQIATLFSEMKQRNVGILYDEAMCDALIEELFNC